MLLTFILATCILSIVSSHFRERQTASVLLSTKQSTSSKPSPSPSPKAYNIGRRFWISSKGEMRAILNKDKQFTRSLQVIQNFSAYIENRTLISINKSVQISPKQPLVPCNSRGLGFHNSMWSWVERSGLPLLNKDCITELIDTVALEEENENGDYTYSRKELHETLIERSDALYRHRFEISDTILGNWSHTDVARKFNYSLTRRTCGIYQIGGVRLGKQWYTMTSITNDLVFLHVPLYYRQYLSEILHADDDGNLSNLRVKAQRRPRDSAPSTAEHKWINDTTTLLVSSDGTASLGSFNDVLPEDVPSVRRALEVSDLWVQQADDAITPSNLAILLLPLVLNLIPIAFISEVKSNVLFLYTILSDVVTVIPLGIKGIELVVIGRQRHISTSIAMTSPLDGTRAETATMQLWTAECHVDAEVYSIGVLFIVLSISFLIIGVVLEIVALAWKKKRVLRRRMFEMENEPLMSTSLESLRYSDRVGVKPVSRHIDGIRSGDVGGMGVDDYDSE